MMMMMMMMFYCTRNQFAMGKQMSSGSFKIYVADKLFVYKSCKFSIYAFTGFGIK